MSPDPLTHAGEPNREVRNAPAEANAASPARIADVLLVIACALGIAFLLFQLVTFSYGRDQGIYAMVGKAITAGKMPYRDAWDFKPPGVFLVYALSRTLFGATQTGIRIVEAAGLVAMIFAMTRITERWWGDRRIGLLSGGIAVLVHAQLDFWHTAQPESFGGMLTIFALWALGPILAPDADPEPRRKTALRLVACGAIFGATGLLKPPLAGGGAVIAAALAIRAFQRPRVAASEAVRDAVRPALLIAAGGAAPIALCALWFLAKGALADLWAVLFVFTPHYTKLSWVGESVNGMAYWGFTEWLSRYSSVPTIGVLLMLGFQPKPRERLGAAVLAGIIAIHIAGVVMQGKFFPYHYGATWPLTALLAGLGYWRVWERLAPRGVAGAAVFFAIFTLSCFFRTATKDVPESFLVRCGIRLELFAPGFGHGFSAEASRPEKEQIAIDKLASIADVNAVSNRAVARLLQKRVPPDRTVFVWGFEPVIYDLADRTPSTRYLYNVPQRVAWAKAKERAVLLRDLAASPPAAIVVEHYDVFPAVTGDAIDSSDTMIRDFPELLDLLARRYGEPVRVGGLDVYFEGQELEDDR